MATAQSVCMTVGSSDSSGGAGIQGDVKTCMAMGAYCATVVVGITAQNTRGVVARADVPLRLIADQVSAVMDDIHIDAIKIGTVWSAEVMHLLADRFQGLRVPIVFDPVMKTSSGSRLNTDDEALEVARQRLLAISTVVTPNVAEAKILTDARSVDLPATLSELVFALGAKAVLITDAMAPRGGDWLFDGTSHHLISAGERHPTGCEHGAGCAHSTALAILLSRGFGLLPAAQEAHTVAAAAVRYGDVGVGVQSHPVDVAAGIARLTSRSDDG
ncbi:bifunctional hydroxymethylpyrimidine kinase/phosphomethylpyrimidine kinase [Streptomyces sp. 3211]|uniref:bifunctional hydroxymethylpyrimidine kinase/phosphomethylpyrimidine kinase n=1 Tax=Streptomyces sp. 3211 TaxID=1964449 RepID=UPI001331275A|nr:bifunctional hydroxymethylpyrimidine kinase/phosphomethylpyrimidine kinase [Streptomyces sp. 3211]